MKKLLFFSIIVTVFIGCGKALGPDYVKPKNIEKINSKVINKFDNNITAFEWWQEYKNKDLDRLIKIAFDENKDISILLKQIKLTLNSSEIDNLSFLPTGSIQDSISRSNSSGKPQTTHKLGVALSSFEFDYLGKMAKTIEMNNANINIAQENLALLYSTISFEIGSIYGNIWYYDSKLNTIKTKIDILNQIKYIYQKRFENGVDDISSSLDIDGKIATEYQNYYSAQMTKDNYLKALKTIVGSNEDLNITTKINSIGIPSKISSRQLENRFDIQIAEQNLINKNAKISMVKTLYYPSISISAFGGIGGSDSKAFSSMSPSWSLTPNIMWNIFDISKTDKLVNESQIQKEQALDSYIKTINDALIEVQNNYDIYEKQKNNLEYSESHAKFSKNKFELLKNKFDAGMITKVQLLDMEYAYLDSMDILNSSINNLFQKEMVFKKSIGGTIKNKIDNK